MQTALNILGRPLKCDECGELTPINLLDAVLLDPDGNAASDELYCEKCWPKHKVVPNAPLVRCPVLNTRKAQP